MVDFVYVAASAHDARFTRICLASVRRFYPDVPLRLLPGGKLNAPLVRESRRYWGVEVADMPPGDYGWGFVKLEPLFGPRGERFMVLDSDTVMTGPVLDMWTKNDAPFLVDDQKQSNADARRLYYDWEKVREADRNARPSRFVFNSGQWFGTAGILVRDDFSPWVEWTMPRRLRYPNFFMPGDQGVLNYVLNQKAALDGLQVGRKKIMRWPGHGMEGLDAAAVSGGTAAPIVVHWAGMKKARQRDMVGADLLAFFEEQYYRRLPAGAVRRRVRAFKDVLSCGLHFFRVWVGLAFRQKVIRRFRK